MRCKHTSGSSKKYSNDVLHDTDGPDITTNARPDDSDALATVPLDKSDVGAHMGGAGNVARQLCDDNMRGESTGSVESGEKVVDDADMLLPDWKEEAEEVVKVVVDDGKASACLRMVERL